MKSPHIAYICADPGVPVFGHKGCSVHTREVVSALLRRGARVSLFAARFGGAPTDDLSEVVTYSLPCPREAELAIREQRCLEANKDLRQSLEEQGPFDFVYERYSLWSFSGMNYAKANQIPGLLEVNAPLIEEQAAHRGLVDNASAERAASHAFANATALIAVSDEIGGYLKRRGARAERVHVIPNGVNVERFPPDLKPKWSWPENRRPFTVGFVGTLKPWHGLSGLIESFGQLRRRRPNARLLLVGDGPERARLEARVRELGLTEVTHFTGAVAADEIPRWLAAMDVAVAPYPKLESFYFSPLKVYEYMAASRAVVASRIGQLNELLVHERNGLLCQPDDADDLADQLERLHDDSALRAQLGAAGRKTVMGGHTWDHVAERILSLSSSPEVADCRPIQHSPATRAWRSGVLCPAIQNDRNSGDSYHKPA